METSGSFPRALLGRLHYIAAFALLLVLALSTRYAFGATTKTVEVLALDYEFQAKTITINVGDTVSWPNKGVAPHTVTASDNSWGSANLDAGQRFAHTFTKPGTYNYFCKYHGTAAGDYMAGTVVVQAPAPVSKPSNVYIPMLIKGIAGVAPAATPVDVVDFTYSPKNMVVAPGTTVRFTNRGQYPHTVTASNGAWDSGTLNAGGVFEQTFTTPGTYAYYCTLHGTAAGAYMAGTIIVQAPGSTPIPTPTSPPAPTSPPPPPTAQPGSNTVGMVDFNFTPKNLVVAPGATVRFANQGQFPHTVTASNGAWDSGNVAVGGVFTRTFATAGVYAYYCTLHGSASGTGMAGTIIVQAPGSTPIPTPTNPPAPTSPPPPPPPPAGTSAVSVFDFGYTPKTLTISAGTTVRFTNVGKDHTVTASDNSWDSGRMATGAAFSKTFTTPGTYNYYCVYHGGANGTGMAGTIIVQAAGGGGGGGAPTPTATTPPAPPASGRIKATLTGGPNWPAAAGFAEYENKSGSQRFYLELKAGRSYQTASVDVFINGVQVAVAEVNKAGECRLELRSVDGVPVPAVGPGSVIVMKLASGELLATGTF